jgi:hypothetical protein
VARAGVFWDARAHRHHAAGAAHSHHLPQRRDRVRYVLQNLVRVDHVE